MPGGKSWETAGHLEVSQRCHSPCSGAGLGWDGFGTDCASDDDGAMPVALATASWQ